MKERLDKALVMRGLASSRSQAENYIRLGDVLVDGVMVRKSGRLVADSSKIDLIPRERYVSRAGLKLASVARQFDIDFTKKVILDIGSSTGGFTDFALRHGAQKVYAVDVGTHQLHSSLRGDKRIELHEKTDIRNFYANEAIDIIVADVSFISLREILPHVVRNLMNSQTLLIAMVKPQFEAGRQYVNKGVIKNDKIRRQVLADFETWAKSYFIIDNKRDSKIAGSKGNVERFYVLRLAIK